MTEPTPIKLDKLPTSYTVGGDSLVDIMFSFFDPTPDGIVSEADKPQIHKELTAMAGGDNDLTYQEALNSINTLKNDALDEAISWISDAVYEVAKFDCSAGIGKACGYIELAQKAARAQLDISKIYDNTYGRLLELGRK